MGNNLLSRPPVEKQTTGWVRKLKQLTVFLLLLITGFVSKAQFSVANIDGNPIEWSITNVNSIPIHAYTLDKFGSGVVDDQFSTGTKDFFTAPGTCNTCMTWADGQTKSKNDLANAAAVLTDNKLFFAGDRTSNNGDAQIGFWFYLNGTAPRDLGGRKGDFNPTHVYGDLLILADFTGGGRNGKVTVLKWVGGTAFANDGVKDVPGSNGNLDSTNIQGTVAENNDAVYPIPGGWTFINPTYATNEFYEGYVDFSLLDLPSLCFASFLLEARSSQEVTASLDDFVGGAFNARPQAPTVQGAERCGPGELTLSATCSGSTVRWYAGTSGGAVLGTGSTFPTGSINATTTYYASCYNAQINCESDRVPVTATINPLPKAQCSKTDVSCNGGSDGTASVQASGGTGGYTYLWSNGKTTASISGLSIGTYTVTVTDSKGCTATCSSTVGQPTKVTADCSKTDVSCNGGSDGSASVVAGGGTPGYTYLWSNGATTASASGLAAGTYTVTVTDSKGCTAICSATVGQPTKVTAICSKTDVSCNGGSDGTASVVAGGGTPGYTYLWSNGATTAKASGLVAGTYTVTVTDSKGCTATCTATVGQPTKVTADCSKTDVSCNGGSDGSASVIAGGGTPGYTYKWSNGATTATASGLTAGTYTVTVTDSKGCTASCSATVGQPTKVTADCSKTDASCNGGTNGSVSVVAGGGTPGYTYKWSNGATTSTVNNLPIGTYTVTVTDSKGCTATCAATVGQPSNVTADCSKKDVSCNGGSDGSASVVAGGGTPGYTYKWSSGQTTASISGLTAGTYTVTVTDTKGCQSSCTATVGEPTKVTADCSKKDVSCNGGSDGSASVVAGGGTPGYTYKWSSGQTTASISGLTAGTYTVTVTDSHGCTASCSATVGEPTKVTADCSKKDVSCNGGSDGSASVVAGGGTPGYTYKWSSGQTTASISGLTAGTYTVTVTDSHGCTASCSATVGEPTKVTADCSKTDVSCNGGSDGSASVVAGGGTPGYTYKWSNGATTASVSGLTAGTYTVTVTDSHGCTASCSATVGEPDKLVADCKATDAKCNGDKGSITVTASGGTAPYTGEGTFDNVAGTYTYTVTDAHGCTASTTCTINEPTKLTIDVNKITQPTCYGGSGSIVVEATSASGGTPAYQYYLDGNAIDPGTFPVPPGQHEVCVVDANGCKACTTVEILNGPTAPVGCEGLTNTAVVNCGQSGTVTGLATGGNGTYTCSATFDATAIAAGWIVNNCSVDAGSGVITVSYTSPLNGASTPATLSVNIKDAINPDCSDATCTIQLTCNGLGKGCTPGFWKTHPEVWDSYTDPVIAGGNNGAIPGLPAGLQFITTTSFNTYFGLVAGDAYLLNGKTMLNATQQNGGGCNALARHGVSALLNAAAFGNDYLSFVGFGVTSYQDLYNALKTAFKTGNCTALATKLGEINTAFDINGICSNLSKATPNPAIANKLNQLVTIASDADQSDLKVSYYPNPFRDRITFNFVSPVSGRATLEVYNIAGQRVAVVFDGTVRAGIANSVNYDAKGKAAGMIIYKLNVEGKTVRGKIQQIK